MHWDDLRIAQAIFQTGSYAEAAKRLAINETTVARRLTRLEDALGLRLFEAVDGLRQPTDRCREIVALVETMALQADRIGAVKDGETGLSGRRRIATTDSIAADVFAPRATAFLMEHPGLSLDFLVSTANVNFSRWEADIAVRLARPDKGEFAISKLADIALYYFEPAASGPDKPILCTFPDDLAQTPEAQYLAGLNMDKQTKIRTKNYLVIKRLITAGQCCAVLPSYACADLLADSSLKATRLSETRAVWLLVQSHLRHDPVTRMVVDWIKQCFAGKIKNHKR